MVSRKIYFPLGLRRQASKCINYSSYAISGRIEEKANFVVYNIIA